MIAIAPFPRRLARWLARLLGLVLVVACGSEFSGTSTDTNGGAAGDTASADGGDSGAPAAKPDGGGSVVAAGHGGQGGPPSDGGDSGGPPASGGADAGAAGASGPSCTPLQPDKPSLPANCQLFQNRGCDVGSTCITLEEREQDGRFLCMPTGITTSCADSGCLADYTCACLAADFRFDKTGLDTWKCCDTAAGPVYVTPSYLTCPR